MTAEEIIELMMSTTLPEAQVTNEEIAELLARRVAALSGKLNKEEMYGLIAIGSLLFQPSEAEDDADMEQAQLGFTEDLLIKTLKVGGNA